MPVNLVHEFPFRQVPHLVDQPLDFRPMIVLHVIFRKPWRRRIGKGLDPHHVEIGRPRRQFGTAACVKQWATKKILVVHADIVRCRWPGVMAMNLGLNWHAGGLNLAHRRGMMLAMALVS